MEDQASWRGHTFTLMIFGGIVVLCSIFFVLGMLVGRTQGQKLTGGAAAAAKAAVPAVPSPEERPELIYDSRENKQPALEAAPAKPVPVDAAGHVSFQVSAMSRQGDAEKILSRLKKQGFSRAFILEPLAGDPKPVYRVQVGPIADPAEAESTKQKLQAAGYAPIRKP